MQKTDQANSGKEKKNKQNKPSSLPPWKVRHRDLTLGKKKEKKEQAQQPTSMERNKTTERKPSNVNNIVQVK